MAGGGKFIGGWRYGPGQGRDKKGGEERESEGLWLHRQRWGFWQRATVKETEFPYQRATTAGWLSVRRLGIVGA